MNDKYEYVIWLEIHIKLNSINKLFCQCKNEQDFEDLNPNTNVCPVCTAQPWALPRLNLEPLEKAVLLGCALNCDIPENSRFDRKSYFYPDLPSWFQITQLSMPTNGTWYVEFYINDYEEARKIRIERAHIENDAGKTIHDTNRWILDFNRAGTPLVEIVTYPDFKSDEEVIEFLKELQRMVRYNWIWYADLEKWQMRCDVNISTRLRWSDKLWVKVEIKNMNSFGAIKRAIENEFNRQIDLIDNWKQVDQETRWWDDDSTSSYTMRSKENALDYRYFPEPDLPVLKLEKSFLDNVLSNKVESPFNRIKRYKEQYWFNKEYINWLIQTYDINNYFEYMVTNWIDSKIAARWTVWYILRFLNDNNISINELKFSKEDFLDLLKFIQDWKLADAQAKQVIIEMFETGEKSNNIIENKWLKPVDLWEIEIIIKFVIQENEKAFNDLRAWESKAIWFLVWQVMKKSWWKADPKIVKDLIEKFI